MHHCRAVRSRCIQRLQVPRLEMRIVIGKHTNLKQTNCFCASSPPCAPPDSTPPLPSPLRGGHAVEDAVRHRQVSHVAPHRQLQQLRALLHLDEQACEGMGGGVVVLGCGRSSCRAGGGACGNFPGRAMWLWRRPPSCCSQLLLSGASGQGMRQHQRQGQQQLTECSCSSPAFNSSPAD